MVVVVILYSIRFYMDVSLLQKGVGSLPALGVVLMMEGCLVTSVVLVYPCFKVCECSCLKVPHLVFSLDLGAAS